jgi:hypothetical protein
MFQSHDLRVRAERIYPNRVTRTQLRANSRHSKDFTYVEAATLQKRFGGSGSFADGRQSARGA